MSEKRASVARVIDDPAQTSICATLAGIEFGEAHISRSAGHGYFPWAQVDVVMSTLMSARNALKGIITHMPPDDPNIAKITDVIARLG